uniref:BHLH domain-containing protein n=1 Tax=Pelusios castaneus TaxID=367368 RepID=A0A8C8REV5_9SAUR
LPGMVSRNTDLEFDSLQPFFYPDEDDFYLCRPDSTFPGEDIWKKFALLSACPLAPRRVAPGGFQTPDPLDLASKLWLLPAEADLWGSTDGGDLFKMSFGESKNLNSVIIQDCMWSAFSVREQLERAVSEKVQGKVGAAGTASVSITTASPGAANSSSPAELNHSVAPAVVFPFPGNRSTTPAVPPSAGDPGPCHPGRGPWQRLAAAPARAGPQASSGRAYFLYLTVCISKDDDEVEEIDVVTVEKKCSSSKAVATLTITVHPKNTTLPSARTHPDEWILKPSALIDQQHNYAAFSPYIKSKDSPPQKKLKNEVPPPIKPIIQPKSKSSSPQNGDSKERKCRWHQNSLERQRNKELRARFLTLWGHVPELVQSKKAAKILILKKATDYIHSLVAEEQILLLEKEKLQARQQELLKKIEHIVIP